MFPYILIPVLCGADALLTLLACHRGATELNPVAAWAMVYWPGVAFVLAKELIGVLAAIALYHGRAIRSALVVDYLMVSVVIYQLVMLFC